MRLTSYEIADIKAIAKRASALARSINETDIEDKEFVLDISAAMMGGCRLNVSQLLQANDENFAHDVFGIRRHLNRQTYALEDCFHPRYAR